jgi:hypothetical protein
VSELRAYLSSRSSGHVDRMWVWGLGAIAALAGWGLIGWLYPGWWPLGDLLPVAAILFAFMAGRQSGWLDCWQEVIRYMIKYTERTRS